MNNISKPKSKGTKGKIFEKNFQDSCKKQGIFCTRLRDNQLSYTTNLSTFQQPYDFECYMFPCMYCLELKCTNLSSVSFERNKDEKNKKMLHYHQIEGLHKASQHYGVEAGILINFKTSGNTYYLPIESFMEFFNSTDKKSISEKDICSIPSFVVDKKLLRTNYEYNIKKLFDNIRENTKEIDIIDIKV